MDTLNIIFLHDEAIRLHIYLWAQYYPNISSKGTNLEL